jgi:hypothetical protein
MVIWEMLGPIFIRPFSLPAVETTGQGEKVAVEDRLYRIGKGLEDLDHGPVLGGRVSHKAIEAVPTGRFRDFLQKEAGDPLSLPILQN